MKSIEVFRKNLRFYRYSKDYSQEKLGELCNLSTHYISDLEQGKYSPTFDTYDTLAEVLEIPVHVLFMENTKASNLPSRIDAHRKKKKIKK